MSTGAYQSLQALKNPDIEQVRYVWPLWVHVVVRCAGVSECSYCPAAEDMTTGKSQTILRNILSTMIGISVWKYFVCNHCKSIIPLKFLYPVTRFKISFGGNGLGNAWNPVFMGYTETEMLSCWWNFNHWLHRKLSFWQLSVQPVMKFLSKWWHFCFSVVPDIMMEICFENNLDYLNES